MTEKPVVGVTGPDHGGIAAWWMIYLALLRAGARPLRITPSRAVDKPRLDALVIGGGTDVEPKSYGQEPQTEAETQYKFRFRDWFISILLFMLRLLTQQKPAQCYDPLRDSMEKSLIEYALGRNMPVLGICRGAQLLNIVTGGSLHQNISEFYSEEPHVRSLLPRKRIVLERETKIASLIQDGTRFVNALHDQAIDQLGKGMMVTARDLAGVVQAIEHSVYDFVLGVQWHPEYLPQIQSQQRIFAGLVACAKQKKLAEFGALDD
jgi:putative glutamine amidotransferase